MPAKANTTKKLKKQIAAMVAQEVEAQAKKSQDKPAPKEDDDIDAAALIASVVKEHMKQQQTAAIASAESADTGTKKVVSLKSILKKAKNPTL